MKANRFHAALLHPRYWLTWFGFAVLFLVIQLPYSFLLVIARGLSVLMLKVAHSRRKTAARNLELCFPDLSDTERLALLEENFFSTTMAIFESGMSWFWPASRLRNLYQIKGFEHIEAAEGQGVLLMGMHFTTLDISGAFYNLHSSCDAMYRTHKNPVYDYLQRRGRERHHPDSTMIDRKDVRGLIRALKRGRVVWYAPDQDYGPKQSVFVPFFGVPAATVTATSTFSRLGNAQVIPFVSTRLANGQGYQIEIHPPLKDFPVGDDELDARRVNAVIEACVEPHKEQYLWAHRRFKSRPPGEPSVYK
jgi:KDO2-lipid IV(A) lauroyltransferase